MKKNRMQELGRNRVEQIRMAEICNGTAFGIFAIWIVWVSTSLLIHLAR